jgi:uncharacterized membrane protein
VKKNKNCIPLLSVALGLWLIALPLTFGYKGHLIEVSDIVCGVLLLVFGLFSLMFSRVWARCAVGLIGLWLQMAPLIFWAPSALMYVNDTFVGAVVIAFSFLLVQKKSTENLNGIPKGWSYNPSGWAHRIPTVGLAMLCWFFSRYMAAYQLGYIESIYDPFFTQGTLNVITSRVSKSFPVSDAGMGALCYTLESLLGWQGSSQRWRTMPWLVLAFGFLVIPVGIVSITLIILQPVVVGSWCSWCLATAASMLLMIVLTAGELTAALQVLSEAKKRGESIWTVLWKGAHNPFFTTPAPPLMRKRNAIRCGVTLPWNLLVSMALGIWLMVSPSVLQTSKDLALSDYVFGPMIAAIAIIAFAEVFRSVRYLNVLFSLGLMLAPWVVSSSGGICAANNILTGLAVLLLSFRKGKILQSYGSWESFIT